MMQVLCSCGRAVEVPYDSVGQAIECPNCQRSLRLVAAGGVEGSITGTGRLIISEGPDRVGEQLILAGNGPIDIGSVGSNTIVLQGGAVSHHHCRVTRESEHWRIEPLNRDGGILVNDERVAARELQTGDVLQIGDYVLEYEASEKAEPAPGASVSAPTRASMSQVFRAPPPSQLAGAITCPSCGHSYPFGSKICVSCGIDLETGRPLLTAREVDEDSLYVNTESVVRAISFVIPFGLYPVASEGFGTRKPYVVWAIAVITVVISVIFWVTNFRAPTMQRTDLTFMLWAGNHPAAVETTPQPFAIEVAPTGEFRWWQLITYAFLHQGVLHLAGNVVFLLVLGSRVNALIGQIKTAILYPLFAICAALAYLLAERHGPLAPMLGASGAVMGMAGMYLVLFPIHRVHMVVWLRNLFTGLRLSHNIFAISGFWVVLFYLAFDVLATLLGSRDHVAHWAHLGGFVAGVVIGLALLVTRQVDAHGGDLISVVLGRRAWVLIGKPSERAQ